MKMVDNNVFFTHLFSPPCTKFRKFGSEISPDNSDAIEDFEGIILVNPFYEKD